MQTIQSNHIFNALEKAIEEFHKQISAGYGKGNSIAGIAEVLAEVLGDDFAFFVDAAKKQQEKDAI